jgi:hypothetical protein
MHTLSVRIVSYLIEYLGEFKLIYETILDYESWDQMGSFDAKKPPLKISFLGTFKGHFVQAGSLCKRGLGLQLRKDSGSDVSCRFSLNRYRMQL